MSRISLDFGSCSLMFKMQLRQGHNNGERKNKLKRQLKKKKPYGTNRIAKKKLEYSVMQRWFILLFQCELRLIIPEKVLGGQGLSFLHSLYTCLFLTFWYDCKLTKKKAPIARNHCALKRLRHRGSSPMFGQKILTIVADIWTHA